MNSIKETRKNNKLSVSQQQAVIELVEKEDRRTLRKELASNFFF